jgi:hypothetical protein
MQAAGVMSERHSDRKTAKKGGIAHHEKSASLTEFRTSFGHFVFVKRACLTDMRAFMLTWAGLLQDLKMFWASVITGYFTISSSVCTLLPLPDVSALGPGV